MIVLKKKKLILNCNFFWSKFFLFSLKIFIKNYKFINFFLLLLIKYSILNVKSKKEIKHLTYIIPNVSTHIEEISLKDIEKKFYIYNIFPIMNPSLYVKINKPKIKYQSRFEIAKDEVKILI